MYDIITKKKHGETLSTEEIHFFVQGFTDGTIPDYQVSALLMAICLKLMDDRETAD
jgi:pyrimidine-nucleoside phosphorylase